MEEPGIGMQETNLQILYNSLQVFKIRKVLCKVYIFNFETLFEKF